MKNVFLSVLLVVGTLAGFSQNVQYFIKKTASLNGSNPQSDSLFLNQPQIVKITDIVGGGATIIYDQNGIGNLVEFDVKEQIGDSAWTFASFEFTLSGNDTLDSITVAGVTITSGIVPQAGTTDSTAIAIVDSINAHTSSPNYAATVSDSTITITPAADSTGTPNGRAVIVFYQGTATPSSGILSGGFYRRNISTIYGTANKLFDISEVGLSSDILINAERVATIAGGGTQNTIVFYKGARTGSYIVSEQRTALQTTINALP